MKALGQPPQPSALAAVALALALAAGALVGAYALSRTAHEQADDASLRRLVHLTAPTDPTALPRLEAAVRAHPHVASARAITKADAAALLTALDPAAPIRPDDLPALHLVDIRLAAAAPLDAPERLQADLVAQGFSVEVLGPGGDAALARREASVTEAWAFGGAGAFAMVLLGLVSLIARAAGAGAADRARLLADLGATRAQTVGALAGPIGAGGFWAGLGGSALAALAVGGLAGLWLGAGALIARVQATPQEVMWPFLAAPVAGWIAMRLGAGAAVTRAYDRAAAA